MKSKLSIITTLFLAFLSVFAIAKEKIPHKDRDIGRRIAKEKGVLKPTEVQKWNPPKEIPKDWIKLDNDFFTVYYPSCFTPEPDGGEEELKLAPFVNFKRSEKCSGYIKEYGQNNTFSIGYDGARFSNLSEASGDSRYLLKGKALIHNMESKLYAGLLSDFNTKEDKYIPRLKWQAYTFCKGRVFQISWSAPAGEITMKLIEKKAYDWPEDFKQIISTFECKEEKKEVESESSQKEKQHEK